MWAKPTNTFRLCNLTIAKQLAVWRLEQIGESLCESNKRKYTGKSIKTETSSGRDFPSDLTKYKLVIHCGGCMLNEKEVDSRRQKAENAGVPFTNYGIAISYMRGIFNGSLFVNKI